tara:strand:+ start:504 stop:1070 length:567 start_codon:yes stop_codon:yes gene_type:complete
MNIHRLFPTLLGVSTNPNHNNSLVERCLQLEKTKKSGGKGWVSKDTYNTLGSHNLLEDKDFAPINDFVISSMQEFCQELQFDSLKIFPNEAWFNIYRNGDYQEYHNHNPNLLSAIYYLKTPKEGSKLFLKNPFDDVLDSKSNDVQIVQPEDGMFVIFRGHVLHCVEKHTDDEPRISLAYNFVFKEKYD